MKTTIRIMKKTVVLFFILGLAVQFLSAQKKSEVIDGDTRMDLFEKHLSMKESSEYKDLNWQLIGPTNISGRCTDVEVVAPRGDYYTIYVAAASGGVWKTENEGTSWTAIFDQEASTTIGDIALDPQNPEVLWVGTGEANIFRSSMAGSGIYRTSDGGKTWKHLGLANTLTISRILIHPENSNIVYVAASGHEWTNNKERGVYKTVDGGASWEKVLYIDEMTGAIDLVMDPTQPDVLYAATWQRKREKWNDPRIEQGFKNSGIWKTSDAGKNWKSINKGLPEAKFRGRIGIDISRSNPNVLYAFVDNYEIAYNNYEADETDSYGRPKGGVIKGASVYRSNDQGDSWTLVSGLTEDMKKYMERHSSTYGWVFGQIRVDPNDENTIYTMGLGLHVSTDGGKTFKQLRGMHGDHHGLWIDPENSNYLVNTNDGGIYISYDKGENWRSFTDRLPLVQFFNIGYDMDKPFRVYGSVQDHGSFSGIVDLSRGRDAIPEVDFIRAPGGEGSTHAIDPTNPDIVYSAGFYGTISRTNLSKSWEEGYKNLLPKTYKNEAPLRGQWVAPFIISPHNNEIIYHGMQYVFRSENRGDTWEKISQDLSYNNKDKMGDIPYQTIFSLTESPLKDGLIYAGTDDGRAYVTKHGYKYTLWTEITEGLIKGKWISRMVASKYDLETVYLTQNGKRDDDFAAYVWKSTDLGKTWQDISANIPLGPVNVIREDPVDKNILYVGTDIGVYVSKDQGKSWEVLGNLPSTYVHDLRIHPRDNVIVIATHGRGIRAMDANLVNGGKRQRRWY